MIGNQLNRQGSRNRDDCLPTVRFKAARLWSSKFGSATILDLCRWDIFDDVRKAGRLLVRDQFAGDGMDRIWNIAHGQIAERSDDGIGCHPFRCDMDRFERRIGCPRMMTETDGAQQNSYCRKRPLSGTIDGTIHDDAATPHTNLIVALLYWPDAL